MVGEVDEFAVGAGLGIEQQRRTSPRVDAGRRGDGRDHLIDGREARAARTGAPSRSIVPMRRESSACSRAEECS